MKSNKTLIIILVSVFILAAIGGLVFYLSGNNDTTDEQTTPETSEEQPEETGDDETGETDGDEAGETETGTGDEADADSSSLVMKAQEFLDNLVASNDRMEALVAECDTAGIDGEVATFSRHTAAAFMFIQENTSNPDALTELPDFPDQVNEQVDRSLTFVAPTAACRRAGTN